MQLVVLADTNRKIGQIILRKPITFLTIAQYMVSLLKVTAYYSKETWEVEAKQTE